MNPDENSKSRTVSALSIHAARTLIGEVHHGVASATSGPWLQKAKAGEVTQEILLGLLGAGTEDTRDVLDAVGWIGSVHALPTLKGYLTHENLDVRASAAVALIRIGDDELFPDVVRALRHPDPRVVIGAALVLGRLRDRRVLPNLVDAFKTTLPDVGAAIAWAIGQCQDDAALPWLLTAVDQGFVASHACHALGEIGSSEAISTLLRALGFQSSETRAQAARALGRILARDASRLVDTEAPLRKALLDDSRKVRLCAAVALHQGGASLSAHLVGSLTTPREPSRS